MIDNFIEDFATQQNDEVDIELAILVDEIKIKDIFEVKFDGTQGQELEDIIKDIDLNLFL